MYTKTKVVYACSRYDTEIKRNILARLERDLDA